MKTMIMHRPNTIQNALSGFDRYFESFFGDSPLAPATKVFNRLPAADIRETENAYLLDMELPGYDEKEIEISVDGSSLSVFSKQEAKEDAKEENGDEAETWILRERKVSSFRRSFKLPENANPEEITADFKNGILRMEVKKRAEARKRTILINSK